MRDVLNPPAASSEYEEIALIGRGQCDVIRARHLKTGKEVAIKQILAPDGGAANRGLLEAMHMKELRHELLVECLSQPPRMEHVLAQLRPQAEARNLGRRVEAVREHVPALLAGGTAPLPEGAKLLARDD